ncbi:MAG: hypothetical protein LBE92_04095 [Chryseobacterium sp.]|jgi:hypothetical protein|nr:hypothetical protein [Chryseobacterium sp.]
MNEENQVEPAESNAVDLILLIPEAEKGINFVNLMQRMFYNTDHHTKCRNPFYNRLFFREKKVKVIATQSFLTLSKIIFMKYNSEARSL